MLYYFLTGHLYCPLRLTFIITLYDILSPFTSSTLIKVTSPPVKTPLLRLPVKNASVYRCFTFTPKAQQQVFHERTGRGVF